MQKSDRGTICTLLEKAGAEFSAKISLERAVAKLQRCIDKRGGEFFLKKATPAQLKILAEMGVVKEKKEEDLKEEKPAKKEKGAVSKEDTPSQKPLSRREPFPTQPVVDLIVKLLSKKKMSRKDLVEKVLEKFPDVNLSTLSTLIADGGNPKYNKGRFPSLIQKDPNRMLYLED